MLVVIHVYTMIFYDEMKDFANLIHWNLNLLETSP